MVLEINNISKKFGNNQVLDEINFEIKKGEIFGILGRNGAGKTVLINIMIGMLTADSGEIKWGDWVIAKRLVEYKTKINLASSYQSMQMQESAWENLITFAGLYGISRPADRVGEVLKIVDMNQSDIKKRKLLHLSSGEMGRVNLAKALLNKPEILFLDEPSAFLDPVFKQDLIRLIKTVNRQWKTTVVFSSHQMEEVESLCDRVVVLKKGKMSYVGRFNKELIKYY